MKAMAPLLILAVTTIACSSLREQANGTSADLLSNYEFRQRGRSVYPKNGVLKLNREPFEMHFKGKGQSPSIYASSSPRPHEQLMSIHESLLSWHGTGAAAAPGQLDVNPGALKLFEGWSPDFEKAWGVIFTPADRAEFDARFKEMHGKPVLVSTGRNYVGFEQQPNGEHVFHVTQVGDLRFPDVPDTLFILLFSNKEHATSEVRFITLCWAPLVIQFGS